MTSTIRTEFTTIPETRIHESRSSVHSQDSWPFEHLESWPLTRDWLLQNNWLQENISQMLNMTTENLTNLINNINQHHHYQQQQQQQFVEADSELTITRTWLITLTVCYSLIFVAGILGNLITCFVISRNKFMHTATNYYLFNLAISDLILLLSGKTFSFKPINIEYFFNFQK